MANTEAFPGETDVVAAYDIAKQQLTVALAQLARARREEVAADANLREKSAAFEKAKAALNADAEATQARAAEELQA